MGDILYIPVLYTAYCIYIVYVPYLYLISCFLCPLFAFLSFLFLKRNSDLFILSYFAFVSNVFTFCHLSPLELT